MDKIRLGYTISILSWSLFVVADIFVKRMSEMGFGTIETVFLNALGTLLIIGCLMRKAHWRALVGFIRNRTFLALAHGTLSLTASFFAVKSFALLPIPEVYVFVFFAPISTFFMARIMLAETIPLKRWLAVLAGFSGIVLAYWGDLKFSEHTLDPWGLVSVACLIGTMGLSMVIVRHVKLPAKLMSLWPSVFAVVFAPFFMTQSVAEIKALTFDNWPYVAGLMVVCALAKISRCESLRIAPASVCAGTHYVQMPLAILTGWLVWDRFASATMLAGAAIVISSGLFLIISAARDEKKLHPEQAVTRCGAVPTCADDAGPYDTDAAKSS